MKTTARLSCTGRFQVINLTFVAPTQNVLLLLDLPLYTGFVVQPHTPLAASDHVVAATAPYHRVHDRQPTIRASRSKHAFFAKEDGNTRVKPVLRLAWTLADTRRGLVTRELWRYSRHPNYACGQTLWVSVFFPWLM